MFIDQVVIDVSAGDGGSGMTAFRRESRVPKGGPSGGDGGRGGSVYLVADPQLWTLLDYTYRPRWVAESGQPGGPSQQTGRSAEDLMLPVPCGTEVRDAATGGLLGEVVRAGDRLLVAQGGRGGLGNVHFATPTRQTPHHYQPGEDGEKRKIELTLKLIADVGLLGQPNAGKSTLLAAVTAARPKIADYPFTTLEPNLGVAQLRGHRSFVIADIPGIIEGAHQGKGLGLKFLRHIERTRVLVYLVPADAEDRNATYEMLRRETAAFSRALAAKPHCVALSKMDLVPADSVNDFPPVPGAFAKVAISGLQRRGLDDFLETLWERLVEERREAEAPPARSGPGTGNTARDIGRAGNDTSEAPPARSGPGTGNTAPDVGRAGNDTSEAPPARSGPGTGNSAPDVGRAGNDTSEAPPARSGPGTGNTAP